MNFQFSPALKTEKQTFTAVLKFNVYLNYIMQTTHFKRKIIVVYVKNIHSFRKDSAVLQRQKIRDLLLLLNNFYTIFLNFFQKIFLKKYYLYFSS